MVSSWNGTGMSQYSLMCIHCMYLIRTIEEEKERER